MLICMTLFWWTFLHFLEFNNINTSVSPDKMVCFIPQWELNLFSFQVSKERLIAKFNIQFQKQRLCHYYLLLLLQSFICILIIICIITSYCKSPEILRKQIKNKFERMSPLVTLFIFTYFAKYFIKIYAKVYCQKITKTFILEFIFKIFWRQKGTPLISKTQKEILKK